MVRLVDYGGEVMVGVSDMRSHADPALIKPHEFAVKARLSGIAPAKVFTFSRHIDVKRPGSP